MIAGALVRRHGKGPDSDVTEGHLTVVAGTVDRMAGGADDNSAQAHHLVPTVFNPTRTLAADGGIDETWQEKDVANALCKPTGTKNPVVAFNAMQTPVSHEDCSPTIGRGSPHGQGSIGVAGAGVGVRRLTPVECCRLQAFPDDWFGAPLERPDGPRYAALGDAVTVNVAEWVGRRIAGAL